jgi:hypothetical protein
MEVVFVAPDEDSDDENHEYEDENGFRSVLSQHASWQRLRGWHWGFLVQLLVLQVSHL